MINEKELYVALCELNALYDEVWKRRCSEQEMDYFRKHRMYSPEYSELDKKYSEKANTINDKLHYFELDYDDGCNAHFLRLKTQENTMLDLKNILKLFNREQHPLDARIEQLSAKIYYTAGPHIRNAYTQKEVLAACLELAASYPASMEVTLYALQSGNTKLSKYFIEKLAAIGRENETNER